MALFKLTDMVRGPRIRRLATAALLASAILVPGSGGAQSTPPAVTGDANSGQEAKPAPAPPTLAEFAEQAASATADLREIETSLDTHNVAAEISPQLPTAAREIDLRLIENARILAQRPSLDLLQALERTSQRLRVNLGRWTRELDQRATKLDRDLARLTEIEKSWRGILDLSRSADGSPELARRAVDLLAHVRETRVAVEKQRAQTMRLQTQVAAHELRLAEAAETIREKREATLERVFERDSPPLWQPGVLDEGRGQLTASGQESWSAQRDALVAYGDGNRSRFLLHGAVFAVLAAMFYWARRRIGVAAAEDPALKPVASVFAWPLATAFVLAFMGSRWMYPQAPRLLWALLGAAALLPTVAVLRGILAQRLWPLLYAIVAFYFVDQVRAIAASMALLPRLLLLAEMLGGVLLLAWFLRRERADHPAAISPQRRAGLLVIRAACGFFAVAAAAAAAGYMGLANLIGNAVLRSAYAGVFLFTIVAILDALAAIALRWSPLRYLRMVERHGELLRRRAHFVLGALAGGLWVLIVLERLALRGRVLDITRDVLTAELSIGSVSISLGDVIAFGLTVWASFLVSRFVRFVLDEEVYPHARLQRGLPYAISNTLHYTILCAGFLLGVAALGFDMTKFTILAGAFTVGVGFGLQQIFNNFVSGIILLFERPVQIGDVIQLDDATAGTVARIGIRASVVRSSSGSEIIVPNSKLISERVVNWTLSDRRRSVDLPISVQHGADPRRVIEVMERTARTHPLVCKEPPPEALLVKPGPDWMGFELRASTDRVEDWMRVRSELAVTVTGALAEENIAIK